MDLEFDKYCVLDGSPTTVLLAPRTRSRGTRSYNRARRASCSDDSQPRRCIRESSNGLKQGSVRRNSGEVRMMKSIDRKKIEFSRESASAFSLGVVEFLCSSDEDNSIKERNTSSLMSISEQSTSSLCEKDPSLVNNSACRRSDNVGSKTSQFLEEKFNMFSPAHLQGILKIEDRNEGPFFELSIRSLEDSSYIARRWKADHGLSWVYTFYNLQNRKKGKGSRWGFKDRIKRGAVIGQMVVKSYLCSEQEEENGVSKDSMVTEYVLYNTCSSPPMVSDSALPRVHPGMEVGAIVMQVPLKKREGLKFKNKQLPGHVEEISDENSCPLKIQVVIPAGNHSLPSDESCGGGPSSLLDRWRSGGECDCGGWDMACQFDVFANREIQISPDHFLMDHHNPAQLFAEGIREAETPAFSMHRVDDDGNYVVGFHAKLSALQVFSICIAILHSAQTPTASSQVKSRRVSMLQSSSLRVFAEEKIAEMMKGFVVSEEEEQREAKMVNEVYPSMVLNPPFSPMARV